MELYEYSLLPINDRADNLWANGKFIINIKEDIFSYNLYTFFGYFIEVKLSNSDNTIADITPFRKGELLNKYLDVIDITNMI